MGVEPPFLYDPPSRYSFVAPTEKGFNPKAATHASWSPPPRAPRRQNGPLINNINRHPDSYLIVPYGNLDVKPMSPRTKKKVKYARCVQLFLRTCALLGALGMLVCVICIKGTQDTVGWIIRIPPAVAIVHTVYAIYHLARSSKGRTPASTASYMLFAAMVDAGLIPFFVFTALMSRAEYTGSSDAQDRWQTLFGNDSATYKVIFSTFLFTVTNGGFHLVSLLLSLYLAIIFRKIAKLPPDMNPLEDNLTSRHKRNKSSISDKRFSQATTASTSPGSKRGSAAHDPLIAPPRQVPFMHTRIESTDSLPSQAFLTNRSRMNLPSQLYQTTPSAQVSKDDIHQSPAQYTRSKHGSIYSHGSRLPPSTSAPSRLSSVVRPSKTSLLNDNWFTYPGTENTPPDHDESVLFTTTSTDPTRALSAVSSLKHWEAQRPTRDYRPLQPSLPPPPPPPQQQQQKQTTAHAPILNPLEMNPPTPPPPQHQQHHYQPHPNRALTPGNGNGNANRPSIGRRPSSFVGAGKGRYYGDLNAASGAKDMGTYVDLSREVGGGGRVVSNSGVDLGRGYAGGGRRDVSGKVVEEGRAGGGWVRWRKGSGV